MTRVRNQATDRRSESAFSPAVRWFGLLGLLGLMAFVSSVITLHLTSDDIDLTHHYFSDLTNPSASWSIRFMSVE